ncbi:MAG TPA: HDOD domain-containing protein, partial [Thermodesulfovibrionales bacterium]|nr:HDOD domain-containing protein [Thermodesulfovibrionales bacterium]
MDLTLLINRVNDLPALPEVVIHLNNLLKENSSSLDNIAAVIEKDAALSSKVLRLANSSYYGLASQVDSVSRAIIVLGANTVSNVVTSVGVSAIFRDPRKDASIDMAGLWMHTLGCAVASKTAMRRKNEQDSERAFV